MAQYNAGLLLQKGEGCEQSDSKSTEMYRRSAKQGFADAQCNYGINLCIGTGVDVDKEAGIAMLQLSVAQGNLIAQSALATLEAEDAIDAADCGDIDTMATNTAIKKATRATRAAIEERNGDTGLQGTLASLRNSRVCDVCGACPQKDPSIKIVFCKACGLK